jgi:predicted O-methyltransferase YrrM
MSKPVDRFAAILTQTNTHRARHGCGAYPYDDGSLLGVIAAAVKAKRILELGCALGFTANWMAFGAPEAIVDTVDMDPEHVRLAQENAVRFGHGARIRVHTGRFDDVLGTLEPGYDLAFFDGSSPTMVYLDAFHRLINPRGVLVSANLHFRDRQTGAYRAALFDGGQWFSTYIAEDREVAMSVRL